jgi:HAD superfamily hydrolase (TIGR01509 family)
VDAVVFDLDGVLLDSEPVWEAVRSRFVADHGRRWHEGAHREMMGMSSPEWSRYIRDRLGVAMSPEEISAAVVERMVAAYREQLPLVPGAAEAVRRMGERWPLALASSSNRQLIDLVLEVSGLGRWFSASVSSEEVARGKPAPDVFLAAAGLLGVEPRSCAAVEDSANGIRAARAARMIVVAVPNRHYPPDAPALGQADVVLEQICQLTPEVLEVPAGRQPPGGG